MIYLLHHRVSCNSWVIFELLRSIRSTAVPTPPRDPSGCHPIGRESNRCGCDWKGRSKSSSLWEGLLVSMTIHRNARDLWICMFFWVIRCCVKVSVCEKSLGMLSNPVYNRYDSRCHNHPYILHFPRNMLSQVSPWSAMVPWSKCISPQKTRIDLRWC